MGLRKPPAWPAVFMAALNTPEWRLLRSMQLPQAAASMKLDAAPASEIGTPDSVCFDKRPRMRNNLTP